MKVAIIIPTMNRPDFVFRQFEFYELMNSPHPIYLSDSSNEENVEKLKNGIKKFKKLNITYQWVPPGKDPLYLILPLVKEKYCIQMGDDDIMIPETISECGDFLEEHPDYGTCMGKQINIRFRQEDNNKPFGIIAKQTVPLGTSLEDENMLARIKEFWFSLGLVNSKPSIRNIAFMCWTVRSVEVEKAIRNITKHFSLMAHLMEFFASSTLAICGKFKVLDKLGYIMQVNDNRHGFTHNLTINAVTAPNFSSQWEIVHKGFTEIIRKMGKTEEESSNIVKWIFALYLARQFTLETDAYPVDEKANEPEPLPARTKQSLSRQIKYFVSHWPFVKDIYYKFNPPEYVTRPESKYYNDFKIVKDFLENKKPIV